MRVIVAHDGEMSNYLGQYGVRMESLSRGHTALDIEEKHLHWLEGLTQGTEPNFILQLDAIQDEIETSLLEKSDVLLAIISHKIPAQHVTYYYNMQTEQMEQTEQNNSDATHKHSDATHKHSDATHKHSDATHKHSHIISCYSEKNQTDAINYIKCMRTLMRLSKALHKPLIIYASIWALDETYSHRALTYSIINHYLAHTNSVFFIRETEEGRNYAGEPMHADEPMQDTDKFYLKDTFADKEGINHAIRKGINRLKGLNRQGTPLYNDVFYQRIDSEQEIYVLLLAESITDPAYYEALGLQYIQLEGNYSMLHGKKSIFETYSAIIRPQVSDDYHVSILTHAPCERDDTSPTLPYYAPLENLIYRGSGVYIGVITTDDVDYTNVALRTPDGFTRIGYIWDQVRGDLGIEYFQEQINTALASPNPGEIIRVPVGESAGTMLLAIAGGWSETEGYRSIAPEAEFVVAKVGVAPAGLQRIYGGMPSRSGILLEDAVLAMLKLVTFAAQQGRPLVLIMPFNGNIDAHDTSLPIQEMVSLIARRPNVTLIVPAGDEADKQHHYSIESEQEGLRTMNLIVSQSNQNVVGVIYQWFSNMQVTNLYPPIGVLGEPINLRVAGVTRLDGATIYTSGEQISFMNGTVRTLFRIENPRVGQWRIETLVQVGVIGRIALWISQQELNPAITFSPFSTIMTIGSTASIRHVMSVGAYDQNTLTVIRSSGRGEVDIYRTIPTLVTYGRSIIAPCRQEEWFGVTGTLPAASIMAGAVAALYSKYSAERRFPLPNTVVMNSIIIDELARFDTMQYPNPSQGYGVFSIQTLDALLRS